MPDLGKVTVFQPNRTTITSPNYRPKPNVALAEITDVNTDGVQDGYSLVFSSANNRFEMNIASVSIETFGSINGGTF